MQTKISKSTHYECAAWEQSSVKSNIFVSEKHLMYRNLKRDKNYPGTVGHAI